MGWQQGLATYAPWLQWLLASRSKLSSTSSSNGSDSWPRVEYSNSNASPLLFFCLVSWHLVYSSRTSLLVALLTCGPRSWKYGQWYYWVVLQSSRLVYKRSWHPLMPERLFRAVKSLNLPSPFPIRVSIFDAVLVSSHYPTRLASSSLSCLCRDLYSTIYCCLIPCTRSWLSSASSLVTYDSRGCVICCGVWISSWIWVSNIYGVGSRTTFGFSFAANAAFKSYITLATIDICSAWISWLSAFRIPFVSGISSSFP